MINAKELYEQYMITPVSDIPKFIKEKTRYYNVTEVYIRQKINEYAKGKVEEYEKYAIHKEQELSKKKKYVKVIDRYLLNPKENKYFLLTLGNKITIKNSLKNFIRIYPEATETIKNIIDNLDDILLNNDDIIDEFIDYIAKDPTMSVKPYIQFISTILKFDNREDAISFLKKKNISDFLYNDYLNRFNKQYPYFNKTMSYLNELYTDYFLNSDLKNDHHSCSYSHRTLKALKEIEKILNTNYSVEEYCSMTGYSLARIKNSLLDLEKYSYERYKTISKQLESRMDSDNQACFERDMKKLAYKILSNKDFDLVDYYLETLLVPTDYLTICKRVLYDKNVFEKLNKKIKILDSKRSKQIVSKEQQLNIKTIKYGYDVTREEKEQVFEYLEENHIPIDTYFICLNKYVKKKVSSKVKIKK